MYFRCLYKNRELGVEDGEVFVVAEDVAEVRKFLVYEMGGRDARFIKAEVIFEYELPEELRNDDTDIVSPGIITAGRTLEFWARVKKAMYDTGVLYLDRGSIVKVKKDGNMFTVISPKDKKWNFFPDEIVRIEGEHIGFLD